MGQTTILQDKSGNSSVLLNDGRNILINSGATSISSSFVYKRALANKPEDFMGINFKFKSVNSVANVLSGYELDPEFSLGAYYGQYLDKNSETSMTYWFGSVNLSNSNFKLLKENTLNVLNPRSFFGGNASLGINNIGALGNKSYILGLSAGFAVLNNLTDLKAVEIYKADTSSLNGEKTILLRDKKSGFSGQYYTANSFQINFDFYYFVFTRVGFGGYFRTQQSSQDPRSNAGVGLVIGQSGAPSHIVLSILYQFNDVFNQLNKENDFIKRGGINFVAGYSF
jgi:hypothetical protein